MPSSIQIPLEHQYPHKVIRINDNTTVVPEPASESGNVNVLYVIASPRGEDRKIRTIRGGVKEFLFKYGIGSFDLYGQPYLNAYAGLSSGNVTAHILRVSASDATFARTTICARYKINDDNTMTIMLVSKIGTAEATDYVDLEKDYTVADPDTIDGFKEVKLFGLSYNGRCAAGNDIRVRVISDAISDKENKYKNYTLELYMMDNGTNTKFDEFPVSFCENAKVGTSSIFADNAVKSELINFVTFTQGFRELFNEYKKVNPDTELTLETFDPLLGINKYTKKKINNLTIDTTSEGAISINAISGIPLQGGSDGSLSDDVVGDERTTILNKLYLDAFKGDIDPNIRSRKRYPVNFIFDANYDIPTKLAIIELANKRRAFYMLDCGTDITSKASPLSYVKSNLDAFSSGMNGTIEAYAGKITDPYSGKAVVVTSGYAMSLNYPLHIKNVGNGNKHIPFAGDGKGVINGFIDDTLYPVYDEDLDDELMDELQDARINYLSINDKQQIVRDDQLTRQPNNSNLLEQSNVLVLYDVIDDATKVCSDCEFDFSDPSDIALLNRIFDDRLTKYKSQQVSSISAEVTKNAYEAKRRAVRITIALIHRDIIKNFIFDINVNREDEE